MTVTVESKLPSRCEQGETGPFFDAESPVPPEVAWRDLARIQEGFAGEDGWRVCYAQRTDSDDMMGATAIFARGDLVGNDLCNPKNWQVWRQDVGKRGIEDRAGKITEAPVQDWFWQAVQAVEKEHNSDNGEIIWKATLGNGRAIILRSALGFDTNQELNRRELKSIAVTSDDGGEYNLALTFPEPCLEQLQAEGSNIKLLPTQLSAKVQDKAEGMRAAKRVTAQLAREQQRGFGYDRHRRQQQGLGVSAVFFGGRVL